MAKIDITSKAIDSYDFQAYPIKTIMDWYENGKLNLSPEYQRAGVWNDSERSSLIDTIFCGYPLPAVILYERTDTRTRKRIYDAIDGKQRLESILYYVGALKGPKCKFAAKITNKVDGEILLEKVSWKDLASESQKDFLSYEIPCVIVQGEPSEIQEVFVRLNSTGKKLSRQEIRNAKYIHSKFLKEMRTFARKMDKRLVQMSVLNENEVSRMKDVEFLSELVISVINDTVTDKKKLLDQMMTPNGVDMRRAAKAFKTVERAVKIIGDVLPDIPETRFRKKSDFYSLAYWFASRINEMAFADRAPKDEAGELLRKFALMADSDYVRIKAGKKVDTESPTVAYIQSVREGGDAKSHRQERDKILSEVLAGVFDKKDSRRLFSEVQRRIIWAQADKPKCCKCRKSLTWETFEVDHINPHSKGGRTNLANAALICKSCNASKGNRAVSSAHESDYVQIFGKASSKEKKGREVKGLPYKVSEVVCAVMPVIFKRKLITQAEIDGMLKKEASRKFKTGGWSPLMLNSGNDKDRYTVYDNGREVARYYSEDKVSLTYRGKKYYLTSQFQPTALAPIVSWLNEHGLTKNAIQQIVDDYLEG